MADRDPPQSALVFAAPGAITAGVDEAGRGPLAGPVVAAAVILTGDAELPGLRDSKLLSARRREQLAELIRDRAVCWALGVASVEEIDSLNILHAALLAMRRAVESLAQPPERVLVDGNRCPQLSCEVEAVVGGDRCVPAISAASILAKVHRDHEMEMLDSVYPQYGFRVHKGYPTRAHIEALRRHGACDIHRRSFGPVRAVLSGDP